MTCTVEHASLLEAVSALAKVASGSMLQNARLQIVRGNLSLAATDGQIWLHLDVETKGEIGPICVNALRLKDSIASLSAELVGFQVDGNTLRIAGGRGKRSLPISPADDFPQRDFEPASTSTIPSDTLKEIFDFVSPHVADISDLAKAPYAGIFLFTEDGHLKAIGTDRVEIALIDAGEFAGQVEATIPTKLLALAAGLMRGDVELSLSDRTAELRWLNGVIRGPLIEQPASISALASATKRLLGFETGEGEPFSIFTESAALTAALRGVRALGHEDRVTRGKRVKLTLNGSATLSTDSPEGAATEDWVADLSEARDLEIGFSSSQMERVLRGFGDRVLSITFRDPSTHMKFESPALPGRAKILSPLRI